MSEPNNFQVGDRVSVMFVGTVRAVSQTLVDVDYRGVTHTVKLEDAVVVSESQQ